MGWQEIGLVLLVILLLFGARRLPELGRSLGEGIKEFKKSSKGILDDEPSDDAAKKPGNGSAS